MEVLDTENLGYIEIRVSSDISNAPFIPNLDCDMYVNDADTIQEALCFSMDEKRGHEISFLQFPQNYENITKNDIYACSFSIVNNIDLAGLGGYGATPYCSTGCFHRRESLTGKVHPKDYSGEWIIEAKNNTDKTVNELEEASKVSANCSYERDTQWGKKLSLSLSHVCGTFNLENGDCEFADGTNLWMPSRRPVNWLGYPINVGIGNHFIIIQREAFLGVAPTTLDVALIQHKRWSEGLFQILFSKYCPFIYGHGKIKLGAQMGYCILLFWAPMSFPALYYVIIPPLCLLHGISLFPQVKSLWFLPFAYVFVADKACGIVEALCCGDTLKAWWNWQRMSVIRRTTSYFFGLIENIRRQLGLSKTKFAITAKVVTEDVLKRYEQEVMEFGSSTIMFTIIATLALLNLFSLIGGIKKIVQNLEFNALDQLIIQLILDLLLVMINIPVYQALFTRNDKGRIPSSILFKSIVLASLACLMPII